MATDLDRKRALQLQAGSGTPFIMKMPSISAAAINLQASLEQAILTCDNVKELCALLDQQAATAAPSAKLDAYFRRLIEAPVPHVTAEVFRVYRYTGCSDLDLHEAAASYLTLSCYAGGWYDETINSIGWANELLAQRKHSPLISAYHELLAEAEKQGEDDLLEFCRGYSR